MDKKSRNTIIVSIVALAIVLITVTYAYFSARITGIESASTISLTAGRMEIVYTEGNEILSFSNIYPREEAWVTKTFSLTGYNTTSLSMKYDLGLDIETNEFNDGYLTYDLTLVSSTNGTPISTRTGMPINGTGNLKIGTGIFTNADGDTHNYELKIYFKDDGYDQNDAQGAVFNARVYVGDYLPNVAYLYDYSSITSYDINYDQCMTLYGGEGGLTFEQANAFCTGETITVGGDSISMDDYLQYGPSVVQELLQYGIIENVVADPKELADRDIYNDYNGQFMYGYSESADGWAVALKPDNINDSAVTTDLITSINGKPIISMAGMFVNSNATLIDLNSFDTSHVTDMSLMFYKSKATSLDLSSFDTSNVTNMSRMFEGSAATSLDLSNFDVSNVTNMTDMFKGCDATSIDISSFDLTGKTITGILNSTRIETVSVKDTSNLNLICSSGNCNGGANIQFYINGEPVSTPNNCNYMQCAQEAS